MQPEDRLALRGLLIHLATFSAIGWLLFALFSYPWIVIADHNASIVEEMEQSSLAGVGLFFLSLATIALIAGFFGKGLSAIILAALIITIGLALSPTLYQAGDLGSYLLLMAAQGLLISIVGLGTYLLTRRFSEYETRSKE